MVLPGIGEAMASALPWGTRTYGEYDPLGPAPPAVPMYIGYPRASPGLTCMAVGGEPKGRWVGVTAVVEEEALPLAMTVPLLASPIPVTPPLDAGPAPPCVGVLGVQGAAAMQRGVGDAKPVPGGERLLAGGTGGCVAEVNAGPGGERGAFSCSTRARFEGISSGISNKFCVYA